MKILQVGDFNFDYYDQSLYLALHSYDGIKSVETLQWGPIFSNYSYQNVLVKLYYTLENRYKCGPLVRKLNRELIEKARTGQYDAIFLWRAIHIYPSTIRELTKYSTVIGYNNDQTFSKHHPWWLFFVLKRSIPFYDHYFAYRPADKRITEQLGVSSTIFMPTFDKDRIHPIEGAESPYDVAFVGHYEDDGRDELLLALVKQGFKVRLNGQRWHESRYYTQLVAIFGKIEPAYEGYNEALNSAKVCLSFLSKLNNDTYTRRTLEIPATRTVMLAEYTEDQAAMFEPDVEAVYFNNHKDAINKLAFLIKNTEERIRIAQAGYQKVLNGPYQLADRVQDIIDVVSKKSLNNEK